MIVQIQLDDSIVEAARLVGAALSKAGHAEHAVDPQYVLRDAINIGMHELMLTWMQEPKDAAPFYGSVPLPEPGPPVARVQIT